MTCLHNSFEPLNELSDLSDAYYRKLLNWILHKCLQYVIIVCLFLWVWYLVSPAFQVGRLPETGNKLRHDLQIIFQAVTVPRFHYSKVWVSLLSFWGSFDDNESSAFLEVFVNQFFSRKRDLRDWLNLPESGPAFLPGKTGPDRNPDTVREKKSLTAWSLEQKDHAHHLHNLGEFHTYVQKCRLTRFIALYE